jgi:hypothetical protein
MSDAQTIAALQRNLADAEKERLRLVERVRVLTNAVCAAGNFASGLATDQSYGSFHGGDPRDFSPDHECSTEAEREAHRLACIEAEASEAGREHPGDVIRGGGILGHRVLFGFGVMTFRDPEAAEIERICLEALK